MIELMEKVKTVLFEDTGHDAKVEISRIRQP